MGVEQTQKPLVEDLANVLARFVVGWEPVIGADLAQHPDVVRVMARYREEYVAQPGVTREQWRVTGEPGGGFPPYSFTWPRPGVPEDAEQAARHFIAPILARGDWADGPHLSRRTVYEGAWRSVDTEETKPWA